MIRGLRGEGQISVENSGFGAKDHGTDTAISEQLLFCLLSRAVRSCR